MVTFGILGGEVIVLVHTERSNEMHVIYRKSRRRILVPEGGEQGVESARIVAPSKPFGGEISHRLIGCPKPSAEPVEFLRGGKGPIPIHIEGRGKEGRQQCKYRCSRHSLGDQDVIHIGRGSSL